MTASLFPRIITNIAASIASHAEAVTELDQAIGDGDHVYNLQRGIDALQQAAAEIAGMEWPAAWQKIGMLLMSTVGGASGSLYATLFIGLARHGQGQAVDLAHFATAFAAGVAAMKQRGKAEAGEKTMLDVLIPVTDALQAGAAAGEPLPVLLPRLCRIAEAGAEATRDMLATKGRASFLGERSLGHVDAGARTAQLMIQAVADALLAPELA